jgi:hypothetical protein
MSSSLWLCLYACGIAGYKPQRLAAFLQTKTNHPISFISHRLAPSRLLNVVEGLGPVVITQCVVCHFFVKGAESTHCLLPASSRAGISTATSSRTFTVREMNPRISDLS